jgi:FKBP-type peptidyl-prolyl cis-trans isomerase FkpA
MKRTLALLAVVAALHSPASAQGNASAAKPQPAPSPEPSGPPDESMLYALGVSVARGLTGFSLSPSEAATVMKGISDGLSDKAGTVDVEAAGPKLRVFAQQRAAVRLEKEKAHGKAFRDDAAKAAGATALPSGLVYTEIQAGSGETPSPRDTVKVNYRGTLVDGKEFDSSAKRPEPASFGVDRVIPCWTEGLQKMKVGGKAKLVCPPEIAYGDRGRPGIPPGATLVFELELLETAKAVSPPPASPKPPVPSPSPRQ